MSIHQNLRQLRQLRGLTQEHVATQLGLTRQALSSYESGRTRPLPAAGRHPPFWQGTSGPAKRVIPPAPAGQKNPSKFLSKKC